MNEKEKDEWFTFFQHEGGDNYISGDYSYTGIEVLKMYLALLRDEISYQAFKIVYNFCNGNIL